MNRNNPCPVAPSSTSPSRYSLTPLAITITSLLLSACGGSSDSGDTPDTTAPSVVLTVPHTSATAVPADSTISVAFGEALDCASVTDTSVTLAVGASAVDGSVHCAGALVTFTPAAQLSASTIYAATVNTRVKDAAGNALAADHTWTFTTAASGGGSGADTQAPSVLLVNPAPGGASVALNASLVAAFDEEVDCATVTAATFSLKDAGNNSVSGNLACDGALATFSPSAAFVRQTTYTATLTTGIKDMGGNALASAYVWNFTALAATSPEVSPSFSAKTLHLSWLAVEGATHYRVLEKANASADYVQAGADLTDTSAAVTVPVHLLDWDNARYKVEACTSGGCTSSQGISVEGGAISTIGHVTFGGSADLGTQTIISRDGNTAFVAETNRVNIYARSTTNEFSKTDSIPLTGGIAHMSLSGNGLTLAATVYNSGTGDYDINIYVKDGTGWSLHKQLQGSDYQEAKLALNQDGTRLLIGARWAQGSGIGEAYVYERGASDWTRSATFTYPGAASWPYFGSDVVMSDHGNAIVIVTQAWPMEAYAYSYDGSTWSSGALVTDSGWSVMAGAMSADGKVLALGGYSRVAVFERATVLDPWVEKRQLISSSASEVSFGEHIAVSADGTVIAVGDQQDGGNGKGLNPVSTGEISNAGAVFVFTHDGAAWTQTSVIKSSEPESNGIFGNALTLSSDGKTLVVGAPGELSGAGAFYFY